MSERTTGVWVITDQTVYGRMEIPSNQLEPSYLCFEGDRFRSVTGIGDSRSLSVEEAVGHYMVDGNTMLTADGLEWVWFEVGCWSLTSGDMRNSYRRASADLWKKVLRRHLQTLDGVGAKTAVALAEQEVRLEDARRWQDNELDGLAAVTGVARGTLEAVRAGARALRVFDAGDL